MYSEKAIFNFYKKYVVILFTICVTVFLSYSCKKNSPSNLSAQEGVTTGYIPDSVDFVFHIKPILSDRCFKCHGPDKNAIEGGLSLHTPEGAYAALGKNKDHYAITPNTIDKSSLISRIYSEDPSLQMPPPESNLILSDHEKALLKKWISQGAKYKEHWAFSTPIKPEIPKIENSWGINEIDTFIYAKLEENGLRPNEKAAKEKLIRRVYFDLTGLPPSISQIRKFVADSSAIAYENLIDSLLITQDYAEHMASEWMDISRYADTHGYQDDFERTMWPWRDWVIHAFKKNMPYDQFVTYQLAGDLLPNAGLEQILATGFNRNHKITAEGGAIPEEYRIEYVEDRTTTLGIAFLGLTLECARCHDHKYDPISQKEHFQFFSFFNTIPEKGLLTNADDLAEPYMKITAKETKGVLSFINLQKSAKKEVPVMVMKEMKQPRSSFVLNRGVYDQPTTEVFPDTPKAILAFSEEYPKNRLGLAKWLFDDKNPLTSRVVVNRLWQRMFGNGIVSTSNDFGNQGALPTHPKLLDFLAIKFQEEGWDTRKMLKYIALSETYQQSTTVTSELLEKDPKNSLLAHSPRLRLSAEMIRDQALSLSGLLNREVGGPSVKPYQPNGIWEEITGGGGGSTASYVQSTGEDLYRKSLYTFWKRTVPPPSMMTFDASSRDVCSVKRQETNTPLQALVLLNDPQIIEASRVLAANVMLSKKQIISDQIQYVFQMATSRSPSDSELTMLNKYYKDMLKQVQEKEIIVAEYLSIGSYETPNEIDQEKLAALSLTVHTILNLDETISRG